ncbi:hypothetical protein ACF0H5_001659 [Mactra antiquata]
MFIHHKPEIVVTVFLCLLLSLDGYFAQTRRGRGSNRRGQISRPEAVLPSYIEEAYLDAVDTQRRVTGSSRRDRNNWNRYVPSLPSTEDSDCEVILQVEQRQRGRCVQLGGSGMSMHTYICQSGEYFEFRPECALTMNSRN